MGTEMATFRESQIAELKRRLGGTHRIERDAPLAPLTTFKIGGPADYLLRARSADDLINAVTAARDLELPYFLLGKGANILIGDRGFRGLVIRSETRGIEFLGDARVRAAAGEVVFPDLIVATVERELGGIHHYVGMPSRVGCAIGQNLQFL